MLKKYQHDYTILKAFNVLEEESCSVGLYLKSGKQYQQKFFVNEALKYKFCKKN